MTTKSINADVMYRAYLRMSKQEREKFNSLIRPDIGEDTDIVAYTQVGEPVSRSQYITRIHKSIEQIEHGDYTNHDDLLKELDNFE